MVLEISVALICVSFLVLVFFLILTLCSTRKNMKQLQKDLNSLSTNSLELVQNLNDLAEDLKKKSESLDFIFRFIDGFNRKGPSKASRGRKQLHNKTDQIAEVIDVIGTGFDLFNRIKTDVSKYMKHK